MVYEIRPYANHANRMVNVDYRISPTAQSWNDYMRNEEAAPREAAPTLILNRRKTPLPDAFEISLDVWCVSDKARDLMQRMFGSQVAFYEIPVVVKRGKAPLPSTNIVAFSQFCEFIDWQKSTVQKPSSSSLVPDVEVIALAQTPAAGVFKAMPSDRQMIWIERTFRKGNQLFTPHFNVFITDNAARAIDDAFPETFILREHREEPRSGERCQ